MKKFVEQDTGEKENGEERRRIRSSGLYAGEGRHVRFCDNLSEFFCVRSQF